MLKDSQQRLQATDPRRSFIVQAPAGSGKTEILTQRYLRLLGHVNEPEQIVALTFTRKAASEMRERIILALQQAASGLCPASAHQQQTYSYAAEALNRCAERGWQLLQQPGRLRIITIDSLCQTLCQAIPLQEKQVPYAQISEYPERHYQAAARACFTHALSDINLHQPLKCLLQHLDNRQDKFLELLSELLANRDQWLTPLYSARAQSRTNYEQMLLFIEQHELTRFKQSTPVHCQDDLCQLVRQFASLETNPDSPRYSLRNWHSFAQLDRTLVANLAALILTSQGHLRKSFDHHVGLKRGICEDDLYNHLKENSKAILSQLEDAPDFLDALLRVQHLPAPHYDPEQWEVLQALFTLLPLLVGHLHLIFSEQNEVDFAAISQQALLALGDEEHPTDLTLFLDNAIHHLLVDEFQDTSIQQFQLLTKLVCGWQPDDGKTLFVVGDPMQSIYRFRQAEVGLFLKAKQQGIGPVQLTPLELCCNFRSTATLVDWVNHQFRTIFPQLDDMESGAVSFHPSTNVLPADGNSYIIAQQFPDRQQEAQALIKCVVAELEANPNSDIAILVRSRNQLTDIMQLLREQQISFQGVEIELLARLPHLRDLWSLTQALLRPANRLAWLALLRSPCAGLSLADLHLLANFDKKKSIYHALSQLDNIVSLSEEGRTRARFVYTVLQEAFACRHQQSFSGWIAQSFRQLHGDKILTATEQADLEQFWLLIDRCTPNGQLPEWDYFNNEFNRLYSQRTSPSRLHVMTIHKSKGLEFDCVILPGLSSKARNQDNPLLRWLKLPSKKHGELLLVSPVKAAHREQCLLYDYLGKLDSEKNSYELQRLLYVAVTRAKKRLFLFDSSEKESQGTFRSFLKHEEFLTQEERLQAIMPSEKLPELYRLPLSFYADLPSMSFSKTPATTLLPADSNARQLGIVAHELLQWICDHHPGTSENLPWPLVMNQLKSLGLDKTEQDSVYAMLQQQIAHLFKDPIGQWLIQPHAEEKNEYELLVSEQGTVSTRIIDRTFIAQGCRWIIDFKTGSEQIESQKNHQQQVNEYARLLAALRSEPIKCGLYYLASGHWVQWDYTGHLALSSTE
ncbi:TPA: UvrD-helicase domain-containing protein [Legionella feeleii]